MTKEKIQFAEYADAVRAGNLALADSLLERGREEGVSPTAIQSVIQDGARSRFKFYLSKIYAGHHGYADAARELAQEHGLPLCELEEALAFKR